MDAAEVIKKIKESRYVWEMVEGKQFQIKRLTDLDMLKLQSAAAASGFDVLELAIDYVTGWRGFTGQDFGYDSDAELPFDRTLLDEYLKRNIVTLQALSNRTIQVSKDLDKEKKP